MCPPIFWKMLLEVFHNCLGVIREGQLLSHEVRRSESVDRRDEFLDLDHLKSKSLNFSENEDGTWSRIESKIVNGFRKLASQSWINLHDCGDST
jgi:hypothetical protein